MASKFYDKMMANGPSNNVIDMRPKFGGGSTKGLQQSRNLADMIEDEINTRIRMNPIMEDKSANRKRLDQITAPNHRIRTSRLK